VTGSGRGRRVDTEQERPTRSGQHCCWDTDGEAGMGQAPPRPGGRRRARPDWSVAVGQCRGRAGDGEDHVGGVGACIGFMDYASAHISAHICWFELRSSVYGLRNLTTLRNIAYFPIVLRKNEQR
jgi:hypothetical protein